MKNVVRIILVLSFACLGATACSAAVWEVIPVGGNDLAKAVAKAFANDTIRVNPGQYKAHDIKINKPLTIEGIEFPTISADDKGMIFAISSSDVTITGLKFTDTKISYVKEYSAVQLENVKNCRVINNQFENNFFAIYAANSFDCEISNNTIVGNSDQVISAGNGIHIWYCKNFLIEKNTVKAHRDGIYFEFVKNSLVADNFIEKNFRYGLHFMFSDSCDYKNNQFLANGAGVAVMYTRQVTMLNNVFKDSWGGAAYGLLLKDIKDCRIAENRFERNSIAIHIDGSDNIIVEKNLLIDNGWAIKILANCLQNEIINNDFVNNSFQVATNSRSGSSIFSQNYWSSYQGYDFDRDGFGDVGYRPVSLYSLIVESNPPTLVLLRSLTIEALDLAERIIPILTPETLIDEKPRMKPVL